MPPSRPITRRSLLAGLLGFASTTALAACGGSPAAAPTAPAAPAAQKTPASSGAQTTPASAAGTTPAQQPVTIRYVSSIDAATQQRLEEWLTGPFRQRNPHITVVVESIPGGGTGTEYKSKLLTMAASKTLPDVMYTQGTTSQMFAKANVFESLDSYMQADATFQQRGGTEDFFPEAIRPYQREGKTYALPYDFGPACMVFYKPLFDQYGVSYPTNEWTFENEFREAAVKMSKEGESWFVNSLPTGSWTFEGNYLRPWGGRLVNDDESQILIAEPEAQAALTFWKELADKKAIVSVAEKQGLGQTRPFHTRKVAVDWDGAWTVDGIKRADIKPGEEYDVVFMPKGPQARTAAAMGSGFGVGTSSEHKDAAWILVREKTDEGMEEYFAKAGRSAHARKSRAPLALQIPDIPPNAKAWIDAQDHAVMGRPISPAGPQINDIVTRELELLFIGQKSVAEACETIKRDCEPLLAQNQ